MRLNRFAALAAIALVLVPAARLDAQTPAPGAHPHAQHHARAGQHHATEMPCMHGEEAHAASPAMLLMHRGDLGLSDAQVQRLRALKQDDAAGAQSVLTAEQRTRLDALHASMMRMHRAGGHGQHADHAAGADCCKDGKCCEDACKDAGCCEGGECDAEKCRECCARMRANTEGAQEPRT